VGARVWALLAVLILLIDRPRGKESMPRRITAQAIESCDLAAVAGKRGCGDYRIVRRVDLRDPAASVAHVDDRGSRGRASRILRGTGRGTTKPGDQSDQHGPN